MSKNLGRKKTVTEANIAIIVPDRDRFRRYYLDGDFRVTLTNGDVMKIDKGYRFDAHSVPFLIRLVLPKHSGTDINAALIHDFLIDTAPWHRYNRKFIDDQYTHFMEVYKHSDFRTWIMPHAVRLAGFLRFDLWGDYRGELKLDTKIRVIVEPKPVN